MILHIDMDAFYASVEQIDNPGLKGKSVLVGGKSARSVVCAASYEARRFGVKSAMPMVSAMKKCPHAVVLPVRMDRYKEISRQIMGILKEFSPLVEPISIDEAFLDASGLGRIHGSPEEMARKIKLAIAERTGLTCSIGLAPNKFLAKIASDYRKPDGMTVIREDEVQGFIDALPIEKTPGVGAVSAKTLRSIGIHTLGDVKRHPHQTLTGLLGKFGRRLTELAAGIDDRPVSPAHQAKSMGSEETLDADTADKDLLKAILLKQAEDVGRQLRKSKYRAKTLTLKIKHSDFTLVTRSVTLSEPVQSDQALYTAAAKLLEDYPLKKKARLIGISASSFLPEDLPVQLNLFGDKHTSADNWEKADSAVDAITRKFGKQIMFRASLKPPPKK